MRSLAACGPSVSASSASSSPSGFLRFRPANGGDASATPASVGKESTPRTTAHGRVTQPPPPTPPTPTPPMSPPMLPISTRARANASGVSSSAAAYSVSSRSLYSGAICFILSAAAAARSAVASSRGVSGAAATCAQRAIACSSAATVAMRSPVAPGGGAQRSACDCSMPPRASPSCAGVVAIIAKLPPRRSNAASSAASRAASRAALRAALRAARARAGGSAAGSAGGGGCGGGGGGGGAERGREIALFVARERLGRERAQPRRELGQRARRRQRIGQRVVDGAGGSGLERRALPEQAAAHRVPRKLAPPTASSSPSIEAPLFCCLKQGSTRNLTNPPPPAAKASGSKPNVVNTLSRRSIAAASPSTSLVTPNASPPSTATVAVPVTTGRITSPRTTVGPSSSWDTSMSSHLPNADGTGLPEDRV